MKLIALKRISDKYPKGAIFEEPNPRAKMLVAIGLAKAYVEPEAPQTKSVGQQIVATIIPGEGVTETTHTIAAGHKAATITLAEPTQSASEIEKGVREALSSPRRRGRQA